MAKILQTQKGVEKLSLKAIQYKRFQVLITFSLTQCDKRGLVRFWKFLAPKEAERQADKGNIPIR